MDTNKSTSKLKTTPNLAALDAIAERAAVTTTTPRAIQKKNTVLKPTSFQLTLEEKESLKAIQARMQAYSPRKISEGLVIRALLAKAGTMEDGELVALIKKVIF